MQKPPFPFRITLSYPPLSFRPVSPNPISRTKTLTMYRTPISAQNTLFFFLFRHFFRPNPERENAARGEVLGPPPAPEPNVPMPISVRKYGEFMFPDLVFGAVSVIIFSSSPL